MTKKELEDKVGQLRTMLEKAGILALETQRVIAKAGIFAPVLTKLEKALIAYNEEVFKEARER